MVKIIGKRTLAVLVVLSVIFSLLPSATLVSAESYTPPTALRVLWQEGGGTDQTDTCHNYGAYITNVTLSDDISNLLVCRDDMEDNTNDWHTDFGRTTPQIPMAEVVKGESYQLSVTVSGDDLSFQYLAVYIDWNQNNVNGTTFPYAIDANERIAEWYDYGSGGGQQTLTKSFVVPTGIPDGKIYMRVMLDEDQGGEGGGTFDCGVGYGEFEDYVLNVTDGASTPSVTTSNVTVFDDTSATIGGNVTSDGGATVIERGVVYSSADSTPEIGESNVTKAVIGSGTGEFSQSVSGLSASTTYYVRAYAINSIGTAYGSVESFTTSASGSGTDNDIWNGTIASGFSGGNGTSGSPYLIATGAQLAYMAQQVNSNVSGYRNAYYKLTADIDLNSRQWNPIGMSNSNDFYGNFNGDSYTVSNLSIGSVISPFASQFAGLFGDVGFTGNAVIENVGVENALIYSQYTSNYGRAGGLAGYVKGTVTNCYATGSIICSKDNTYLGGLIGQINPATVTNCYADVDITGLGSTGDSSAGNTTLFTNIGGLIGRNANQSSSTVTNCYATGNVTGNGTNARVGGLLGYLGVAPYNSNTITNCYAAGTAIGGGAYAGVGGLVGYNVSGVITNSYWNYTATATGVGYNGGTNNSISKSSSDMKLAQFVTDLNNNRGTNAEWKSDTESKNGGYPILDGIGVGVESNTPPSADTTLQTVDFETAGSGYVVSRAIAPSSSACWERTNGTLISPDTSFSGYQGNYYFYGENTDSPANDKATVYVTLNSVSVSGYSDLQLKILVAGNNNTNSGYEGDEFLKVQYAYDDGAYLTRAQFIAANVDDDFLTEDSNADGVTDGAILSPAFAEYIYSIPSGGINLQIRIAANIDQGSEEIGFDNIRLFGTESATTQTPPTASNVEISGTAQVGQTLTGSYDYDDDEGDSEGTSTFKWYRADDINGTNKTEISGATAKTYVLQTADVGKYISFEVTPVASTGTSNGTAVESDTVGPVVKLAQADITYGNVTKTYGDSPFVHAATGGSGTGSFTYSSGNTAIASIDSVTGNVTIHKMGTITLTVTKSGDLQYDSASKDCTLTINKAVLTAKVGDYSKTYGEENPSFEVTVTGFVNDETTATATGYVSPIASSTATATTDVGTASITISGGSGDNYTFNTTDTATLTINKKALTATATANNKTYDGNTSATGTISLGGKVGADDVTASGAFAFESADAGANKTVNVTDITLLGTKKDNYTVNATATATATIHKAGIDGITFSNSTVTYDGTEKSIVISGTLPDGANVEYTSNKGTNAGTYNATATITGGTNYNGTVLNATLTINKAQLVAKVGDYSKTYGEENPIFEVTVTGFVNGETAANAMDYTAPTSSSSATAKTGAGTASITISGGSADNYTFDISDTGTLTINKATLTAKVGDYSKTYGEENPSFEVTVTGFVNDETTATATGYVSPIASSTATATTDVGTASITISGGSADNYTFNTTDTATLTINKKALTATATANNKTYDGNTSATGTISLGGIVDGDVITADGTFAFESSEAGANKTVNVTDITLLGTKKDNYTVNVTATATATIYKAGIDGITFSNSTVTYDGTEKSIVISGTLPDGANVEYTSNKGTNAGTYNATATITGGTNYNGTVLNATLTINKATLTAKVGDYSKTYGEENPVFEVTVTGFVNGETAANAMDYTAPTSSSSATAKTGAGTASITISGGSADNYTFDVADTGTLTINKKNLTVTATANNKTYDGTANAIGTISLDGKVGSDDVTASGSFAFENENTGTGKTVNVTGITLSGEKAGNYSLNETTTTTTSNINVKAATITPDSNQSKVYGSAEPTLTYTTSDLVAGDILTGALSRESGEGVRSYPINQGTLNNSNYAITVTATNFEITKKPLTIENITVTKTYDRTTAATAFVTGATLSGVINDDDVSLVSTNMTATFADSAIGEHGVIITGYEITGAKVDNYSLTHPTGVRGTIETESVADITLSVNTNGYNGSWTKEDVTITLNATATSGIKEYQYTTNDEVSWETIGSSTFSINAQADAVYKFRAVSNGNVASITSDGITVKVDKTKPIIENIAGNPTTPKSTNQTITFSASDIHSGINAQTVTVKKDETNVEVTKNEDVYSFVTQGNGQYLINISDNVGNLSEDMAVDVTLIDFDKPTISTLAPHDGKTDVDTQQISIAFSENIKKTGINGDIVIYTADGTVFERTDVLNNRVKITDKTMTVYLSKALITNKGYYVLVEGNIIADIAGNTFDGITSKTAWDFITKSVSEIVGILGLDVIVGDKQYPVIADENDETKYTSVAKPNNDGTIYFTIVPKLTNALADIQISTTEAGVEINGKTIRVTDIALNTIPLTIKVKKPDGTVDNSKTYTITIQRGTVDAKITTKDLNITVDSVNLIGAVDITQYVQAGKQVELVLNVENNANQVTNDMKYKIQEAVGNSTLPLFVDISLSLVVDDTTSSVTHTQNPLTIRIEMPSNIRGGSNYKVVRMHSGVVEVLDTKVDGNDLMFTTDRFSQYAISYNPPVEDDDNGGSTPKTSGSSSSIVKILASQQHIAYINGYEDGSFRADNTITRAEVTAILARLSADYSGENYASGFSDVSGWSSNYVGFANQKGFVNGYEDGTFKPDANMTRAEFATVVAKFLGLGVKADSTFTDSQNHWAEGYISALVEKGIINGYEDNTFKPDANITRAEAVKVINAALDRTPNIEKVQQNISKYTVSINDVSTTHWAYYEIIEAAVSHTASHFNQ